MQGWLRHRWTSLYLLLLSLASFLLFLYGFFPLKHSTGRLASWDELPTFIHDVSIDGQVVYDPGETSVVLMVIDALRLDFVTEELMPFTAGLVKKKAACSYVARAEPPTVTMPRIKSPERKKEKAQWRRTVNFWRDIFAMMTGTVSTFADVALNFGAPAVRGDSVVRAAAARGRRNFMFGDDTWLRLFPGLWAESDGTTSFYVTDYTEVDNNVTRHLNATLQADERKQPPFDLLVLHYLGLDHIGHLEGPRSDKIAPKLREMDDVVRKIFTAMEGWEREGALLVCGDHGMRDAGGHGGGSDAEVRVPLVLARTGDFQCPHEGEPGPTVSQTDLAPSMAYLLRTPIPGDSTGRLLPAVLPADPREHLYLLHYNARENARALSQVLGEEVAHEKECYKQFRRAEEQFGLYLSTGQAGAARLARQYYEESLDEMAMYLTESIVEFDMFAIGLSIVMLFMMLAALTVVTLHSLQRWERSYRVAHDSRHRSVAGAIVAFLILLVVFSAVLTVACAVTETTSNVCHLSTNWTPIAAAAVVAVTYAFFVVKSGTEKTLDTTIFSELNAIDYFLIAGSVIHSLTFIGTSFIEEEHQTWYYSWNTLMLCVLVRTAGALLTYFDRRMSGATEVQDKPTLKAAANVLSSKLLPCWLLLIAAHRFLRTMNQTGDLWAFLPDTADWLILPENARYLQMLMLTGMMLTFLICLWNLQHTNNMFQMNTALTLVTTICIVCFRIATRSLPALHPSMESWDTVHIVNVFWGLLAAQFVFESLTFLGAYRQCCTDIFCVHGSVDGYLKDDDSTFVYVRGKEKNEDCEGLVEEVKESTLSADDVYLKFARSLSHVILNSGMLMATLLLRPHNVILVPSLYATCVLTAKCVRHTLLPATNNTQRHLALDVFTQTLAHYWIGAVFFFYQGNSNSLVSVDLVAGYVGLREYSAACVGLQMGFHTYAAPLLAAMTLFCTLSLQSTWQEYKNAVWVSTNVLSLLRSYSLAVYSCVAAGFKHHLFVWSVFSPKLLYDLAATLATLASLLTVAAIFVFVALMHSAARYLAKRRP